ncbi:hypothetical protein JCM11491_003922 [Sporobolomyces phaffii]
MHKSHSAISRAQQAFAASPRPSVHVVRPLSTCTSTRSVSTPSPPPSTPSDRKNRSLYRKVVSTAVRGAYDLSSPLPSPPRSIAAHGFKPPKLRNTPNSRDGARARLVEFDPTRVAQSRYSRPPRSPPKTRLRKREFSTCARREKASEDSLELEQSWLDVEAGDWDGRGAGGQRLKTPKPGDWVEVRRNGQPARGIYLSLGALTARRFGFLPISGERTEHSFDDITFIIPGLVSPAIASSASFLNSPEFSPSSPEALEMLQKLREVEFAVEEETKLIVSRGVGDLYTRLHTAPPSSSAAAAKSSKKRPFSPPTNLTITTALKALRLSPSSDSSSPHSSHAIPLARQVAMHRLLLDDAVHYLADGLALRLSAKFDLRDPRQVARFEQVRDWIRSRSDEIVGFAAKAAKVREWARSNPPTEGGRNGEQLVRKELPGGDEGRETFTWTKSDQEIIRFLRDTLAFDRVLQTQPHMAIAPSIIKLVDQQSLEMGYEGWAVDSDVKKGRIRQFLSEIGEVAEWENWAAHDKSTGLETWEEMGVKVERAVERGTTSTTKRTPTAAKSTGSLHSTEYYPQDPHDSVRHDFGDASVFTIDDAGAFELDDGISLSPAPPSPSGKATHWVHVHIADPTALLHPGHLVSKLARVRDHTEYFPEKTWSMLPDSFVDKEKLSLGSKEGAEQKTMSFGMRIEEETGEVLESEVKVGVVRKVLRLTYAGVDEALGHVSPPPKTTIRFPALSNGGGGGENEPVSGRPRPRRQIDDAALKANPEALSALRTLHGISKKLLARRAADSALFWNFPTASVSVSPSISPSFSTRSRPTFYASAPLVNLHLPSSTEQSFVDSPASLLVSELMVAANRTAAKFSVEKGLAVPFRTQSAPSATREAVEAVLNLRDPATGQASAIEVLKKGVDFLPGATTPTSGPHWPMGINDSYGYVKVTSPLRRYSDLFSHWQLKSALLPSSAAPPYATPRFDLPSVLSHIQGFDAAAKARHRLSEAASTFWSLFVISRKLSLLHDLSSRTSTLSASDVSRDDTEFLNLLAGGLTAIPLRIAAHSAFDNLHIQPVLIPQLGVRGTLQVEKLDMAGEVGEEIAVKIDEVVLSARSKVVVSRRR